MVREPIETAQWLVSLYPDAAEARGTLRYSTRGRHQSCGSALEILPGPRSASGSRSPAFAQ